MENSIVDVSRAILANVDNETRDMIKKLHLDLDALVSEYTRCLAESQKNHHAAMALLYKYYGTAPDNRGVYRNVIVAYRKLQQGRK